MLCVRTPIFRCLAFLLHSPQPSIPIGRRELRCAAIGLGEGPVRISAATFGLLVLVPGIASGNVCGGVTGLDPVSATTAFSAGALIIPMDTCYNADQAIELQPTNSGEAAPPPARSSPATTTTTPRPATSGIRSGSLYLLAENNIPVNVILNQSKNGLADEDFSRHAAVGRGRAQHRHLPRRDRAACTSPSPPPAAWTPASTPSTTAACRFSSTAATPRRRCSVIQAFNSAHSDEFGDVPLHIINYPFTAPMLGTLQSRPKPVLIDGSRRSTRFFDESGIPDTTAANTTYLMMNGSLHLQLAAPSLGSNGVCTTGCNTLYDSSGNNFIDVVWATNDGTARPRQPHQLVARCRPSSSRAAPCWRSTRAWPGSRGSAGGFGGGLELNCETLPTAAPTAPRWRRKARRRAHQTGSRRQYPASNRFLQIGDLDFVAKGNGGGADGASAWGFGTGAERAGRAGTLEHGRLRRALRPPDGRGEAGSRQSRLPRLARLLARRLAKQGRRPPRHVQLADRGTGLRGIRHHLDRADALDLRRQLQRDQRQGGRVSRHVRLEDSQQRQRDGQPALAAGPDELSIYHRPFPRIQGCRFVQRRLVDRLPELQLDERTALATGTRVRG